MGAAKKISTHLQLVKPAKTSLCLSPGQIQEFFDKGFLIVENVFSPAEVSEMGACLNRITEMAKNIKSTTVFKGAQFVCEGERIDRVVWCGAAEPRLLEFAQDDRVLKPVEQILGSSTMQHLICQFHPKLPGDHVKFEWHQDSLHRRYGTPEWSDINGRGSYVQTLTAIDEVTLENGPVHFSPGSGKYGNLCLHKFDLKAFFPDFQSTAALMKPGSVVFFGPYVVHGSQENNSNLSRRVFINGYAFPGANRRAYPGEGSGRIITRKKS